MKKVELIKLLESVPEDAEIVVQGYQCDMLGDYQYEPVIRLHEHEAMKSPNGSIDQTISNYVTNKHEKIKVWVLE